MQRLLFDAPRRAGSVRQSKKQAADARRWHAQGSGTTRPPHTRGCQRAVRRSCAARSVSSAAPGTPDGHEQQRSRANPPERGKGGHGSVNAKVTRRAAGGKDNLSRADATTDRGYHGSAVSERSAHAAAPRRCRECIARIAARLRHVIANSQGQAPAEDGSRPPGSAASERLYRRSNTWETMRLVRLSPWRAAHLVGAVKRRNGSQRGGAVDARKDHGA